MFSTHCSRPTRLIAAVAVACVVLLGSATAWADSDDIATFGLSTRVALQNAGDRAGTDANLHFGMRAELLYFLGAEFEITQVPLAQRGDIYRPSMRLTGHLHMVNSEYFDFYLGAGLASSKAGDLVDFGGDTTLYRLGGGMEVITGGHWAFGVDLFWNVAGVAYQRAQAKEQVALQAEGGIDPSLIPPGMENASEEEIRAAIEEKVASNPGRFIDFGHYELGFSVRYFF